MKFCTQCGTQLTDEALFCSSCGKKVSTDLQNLVCCNNGTSGIKPENLNKKCMACGKEYALDVAVCPDCGISLGAAPMPSSSSVNTSPGLMLVIYLLSILTIFLGLFTPIFYIENWFSICFFEILCNFTVESLESTVTWIGIAAVVPAVFELVGSVRKNKKMCVVSSAIGSVTMLLLLLLMINSLNDSLLGSFVGTDYLFGEDSPISIGFWGPLIGHIILAVCGIFLPIYDCTTPIKLDRNAKLGYVIIATACICIMNVCFVSMSNFSSAEETQYLNGTVGINFPTAVELVQNEGINAFFIYDGIGSVFLAFFASLIIIIANLLRYYGLSMFVSMITNVLLFEYFCIGTQNNSLTIGFIITWIAHLTILICSFLIREKKEYEA